MFYHFRKLLEILKISKVENIFFLCFLAFLNIFFEVLSLGMLIPFISIIVSPDLYEQLQVFINNQSIIDLSYFSNLDKKSFVLNLIFIILLLFIGKFIISIFYYWQLNSKKVLYESKIGNRILSNFSRVGNPLYLNITSSELIYTMTGRVSMVASVVVTLSNLIVELIFFSLMAIIIIIKYPSQSIIVLPIFIILSLLIYSFFKKKISSWSNERGKFGDKKNSSLIDFFQGIREVIIFSLQDFFLREFEKNNIKFLTPQKKILFFGTLPRLMMEMIFSLTFLSIFFYYIFNDYDYENMILSASVILILSLRILPSFNKIIFNLNQYRYAFEAILKVNSIIKSSEINYKSIESLNFNKKIALNNIDFGFIKNKLLLENLNLEIFKGSKIGIIGETGSGKTTLVDIISGLLKPDKGTLLIDDVEINKLNTESWVKNIGYISQKTFLFNSSIRQNICFKEDFEIIDEKKLTSVLNLCNLQKFVDSKEEGTLFHVGEFGGSLSGGQKQKIGIARALYQDSELLIFDESTSALDEENEKRIIKNIINLENKTIIFISHNHENFISFSKIFKLEDKKLVKYKIN